MKIYTAVTGNYDLLKEQTRPAGEKVQFDAFTDQNQITKTWNLRPATFLFGNARLNAKYHKVLSHLAFPKDQITLWIDGSIEICAQDSIADLANQFLSDCDIALFSHPERYCIYQEAMACIFRSKDHADIIYQQAFRYSREGYPANNGLADCTILFRRHTEQVVEFNKLWWKEIAGGSIRDQISFPYVAWKTGMKVNYLPGSVDDGSLFLKRAHLKPYLPDG